jgi:hypothetical protein
LLLGLWSRLVLLWRLSDSEVGHGSDRGFASGGSLRAAGGVLEWQLVDNVIELIVSDDVGVDKEFQFLWKF